RVTQAAAVEEPLVIAIVAGAAEAGLVVDRIAPVGCSSQLQLFPSAERAVRHRARRRAVLRLGLAALAAWLLAGVVYVSRIVIERRAVDTELAASAAP